MKSHLQSGILITGAVLILAASSVTILQAENNQGAYEATPIKLNAALVVPDGLMVGKGYNIDTVALNDGYNNN